MLEISTSGLMSGDGKRSRALQSTATAPVLDSTKTTLRVCGAPAPNVTAILADAAWRQADAILRNEAKVRRETGKE
jgi:hypothetical protein